MNILEGQFIPTDLPKRRDIVFLGEKPSTYFIRHPEERDRGNYNVTETDFVFQKWIRKYLKKSVYVTDMVKTEGEAGADFETEWNDNPRFGEILLCELKEFNPKIIVAMSQNVEELFINDERFSQWTGRVMRIYHPSYVVRYRKFDEWNSQFSEIVKKSK